MVDVWDADRIRRHYESGECGDPHEITTFGSDRPTFICGIYCPDPTWKHTIMAAARAELDAAVPLVTLDD